MIEHYEMVAKAIADGSRARILKMLEGGELCVCQITAVLDLAPATVSKHLSILRLAGLVLSRKQGRWAYYRLAETAINPYAPGALRWVLESLTDDPTAVADRIFLVRLRQIPVERLCAEGPRVMESKEIRTLT
ncbi:MAG: metalloregulator ArsR/SmtB family transcription factor [Rhodospirillales bacterium]|nr:metalloregulator ArsR/SmtB family transcription factor [Rhodospirillales bacterium]